MLYCWPDLSPNHDWQSVLSRGLPWLHSELLCFYLFHGDLGHAHRCPLGSQTFLCYLLREWWEKGAQQFLGLFRSVSRACPVRSGELGYSVKCRAPFCVQVFGGRPDIPVVGQKVIPVRLLLSSDGIVVLF